MTNLVMTEYYPEFLRYHQMATWQQEHCNLGTTRHEDSPFDDDLMKNVHLYDVVNRKYAGFTQILLDLWYGKAEDHPYDHKMHGIRLPIAEEATGVHGVWSLPEWLYVFMLHRLTGSGINYGKKHSGYHNTLLPEIVGLTIEQMAEKVQWSQSTFYTSVGYQFPAFPRPGKGFKRGGDFFLAVYAPVLARQLADWLTSGEPKGLREIGEWMFEWNRSRDLRAYKFQYAAVVADIADFFPELVNKESHFFYGTNAVECLSYLFDKPKKMKPIQFLDNIMERIYEDTGSVPYDAEDIACDYIRWIESYVRPGHDYEHLDRDSVFSSHRIGHHPYGRQKGHLVLGLVHSFNDIGVHPSDDYVLSRAGLTVDEYQRRLKDETT